jgi:hypothetical protein
VCKALDTTLVIHRPTDTTLRLRAGCPRMSYHLPRKKEKSMCKAPGATLASPSFQSHLAFSLPMLSTGSGCLNPTREVRPARTLICNILIFPEATQQRSPNLARSLTSPRRKRESRRASPVYAFACLHAPNSFVGFASSSPVALMRRLIRPWTVFPAICQIHTLRNKFATASYRQLAGSGTFM